MTSTCNVCSEPGAFALVDIVQASSETSVCFEDQMIVMYECHFPDFVGCIVIVKEKNPCLQEICTKASRGDRVIGLATNFF